MDDFQTLMAIWGVCAIASIVVASKRGRSGPLWYVLGLLLGPFALVTILMLPKVAPQTSILS